MAAIDLKEVKSLRKKLKTPEKEDEKQLTQYLQYLSGLDLISDSNWLLDTKIAKTVNSIVKKKKTSDEKVLEAASALIEKWKPYVSKLKKEPKKNGDAASPAETKPEETKSEKPVEDKKRKKGYNQVSSPLFADEENESKDKKIKANPKKEEKSASKLTTERENIIKVLEEALNIPIPNKSENDIFFDVHDLAVKIEQEIYDQFDSTDKNYKNKCRTIFANLKNPKNSDLRSGVLEGSITPKKLATMSVQEMASNEVKKEREKVQKWYKEAATLGNFNHTTTTMFKCGKCGARETTYYQLQTRSADEPMTTFHTCTKCGNRWKS